MNDRHDLIVDEIERYTSRIWSRATSNQSIDPTRLTRGPFAAPELAEQRHPGPGQLPL